MTVTATTTSYDRVPYKSHPFRQSHPDRLAVIATLHGMSPVPIDRARVLELGCASGGNLVPMADQFPEGKFLGLDMSIRQIQDGQKIVERSGLENVELRHQDILEFDAPPESFDYILCHGVFSWVPDAVQRKILDICRKCLSPNGVAYVSYNTHPGWHMRGMIRDIMRYRAQFFDKPEQQLKQARGLLTFLSESVKTENNAFGKRHEVPAHHNAERYLDEYLEMAGIGDELKGPLFRTVSRARALTVRSMHRIDVLRMIKRRATQAGIATRIGCHTFRATGITAYLQNRGSLEHAQRIAAHESARTTKLYDLTGDAISLDEIERIAI